MIYEKYPPGSLILTEGDKSNNKFYVVLSGEVSILIRNSENVFISENLQKKYLSKMNKERLSVQAPPTPSLDAIERKANSIAQNDLNSNEDNDYEDKLTESQKKEDVKDRVLFKKTKTVIGMKIAISPLQRKKHSLMPGILSSQTIKMESNKEMPNIEEEDDQFFNQKEKHHETPLVPILPFFHLGKEAVLQKLKEMGYTNKELYKGEGFGEVALLDSKARRTATVLALSQVELIVILKKDFLLIRQKFSNEYKGKKKFLVDVLPFLKMINSSSTLDNLIFCFKEARLNGRQKVISEQDPNPEKIFFLMKGKCKIEKKFKFYDDGLTQSKTIHICDVDYKGIFGEEILFETDQERYQYTVTVVSEEAQFFTVNKTSILGNFPKEIKGYLYETFLMKRKMRKDIFDKLAQSLLESSRNPEIQTMIELKIGEKEKIIKNMSTGLRLNFYQKLKNTVYEDFLNRGGSKTVKNWNSDLIFESMKRSILQRKGFEKLAKSHKFHKNDGSSQALIRKEGKKEEIVLDLGDICNCYLIDGVKSNESVRPMTQSNNKERIIFNFNGEQHNHRLEVFRKAKIGNYKGPSYCIPHDRTYMNLWEKAKRKNPSVSRENNPLTIMSNDIYTEDSHDYRKTENNEQSLNNKKNGKINPWVSNNKNSKEKLIKSLVHFNENEGFENKTNEQKNGTKSKAERHLRVFLKTIDAEPGTCEIMEDGRRLHSSKNCRVNSTLKKNEKFFEKFSFSQHLLEVKRNNNSLRKTNKLGTTQTSMESWKSGMELGIFEKKIL